MAQLDPKILDSSVPRHNSGVVERLRLIAYSDNLSLYMFSLMSLESEWKPSSLPDELVQSLVIASASKNDEVAQHARRQLGSVKQDLLITAALALSKREEPEVRNGALVILRDYALDPAVQLKVLETVSNEDFSTRQSGITILQRWIDSTANPWYLVERLITLAMEVHRPWYVRAASLDSLQPAWTHPTIKHHLHVLLADHNERVACAAAKIVGMTHPME
ncbi:MAG: hypothetical protein IT292_05250 [Deltaproteobacteria bacterium]|nr:hypothetical protein [Deltaproteobacteria bacterium]